MAHGLTEVVVLKATYNGETESRAFLLGSASQREEFITRVLEIYRNNPSSVLFQYDKRKDKVQILESSNEVGRIVITANVPCFELPFRLEISTITGWDGTSVVEENPDLIMLHPLKLTMDKLL